MKIKQLIEAKYAEDENPQYTNLTSEKVVKMFFDFEEDISDLRRNPGNPRHFSPKEGLVVRDRSVNDISWLVIHDEKNWKWIALDNNTGEDWSVDPSTFIISKTKLIYK